MRALKSGLWPGGRPAAARRAAGAAELNPVKALNFFSGLIATG